jgi:hypothetical protein
MSDKERIPGCRQFMVFTIPHTRDPKLLTPVIELDGSTEPPTPIPYDNIDIIEKVVLDLGRAISRSSGYNAGAMAVLNTYGFTIQDFLAQKEANKAKKALDKEEQAQ